MEEKKPPRTPLRIIATTAGGVRAIRLGGTAALPAAHSFSAAEGSPLLAADSSASSSASSSSAPAAPPRVFELTADFIKRVAAFMTAAEGMFTQGADRQQYVLDELKQWLPAEDYLIAEPVAIIVMETIVLLSRSGINVARINAVAGACGACGACSGAGCGACSLM